MEKAVLASFSLHLETTPDESPVDGVGAVAGNRG